MQQLRPRLHMHTKGRGCTVCKSRKSTQPWSWDEKMSRRKMYWHAWDGTNNLKHPNCCSLTQNGCAQLACNVATSLKFNRPPRQNKWIQSSTLTIRCTLMHGKKSGEEKTEGMIHLYVWLEKVNTWTTRGVNFLLWQCKANGHWPAPEPIARSRISIQWLHC